MPSKQTPIDKATYVVVDLETTGLDPRKERIIEIGAVKMIGDFPIATFEQLVNPNKVIPPKITKLTGVTNAQVRECSNIKQVLPAFAEFTRDSILVVHNAPFDISFLNRAARDIGIKQFRSKYFDTKLMAQKLKPLLGFYRLANLVEHFRVPYKPCHRALPDALATAGVFSHLIKLMKQAGLSTVDEAIEYFYPKERYDFSHKKELIRDLPSSSGVYLMKDKSSSVIYVGKAKDLNKRVRSYFYSGPKTERQLSLLSEIASVDYIKTGTEIGALLLESKLIKKLKPQYNILGKRFRRYPFVHIDYNDEFPTPKIVKKVMGRGFHYGPFPNSGDLELLVEVVKDLFGLKQCDYKVKPGGTRQPCFYRQVNKCSGPCSGAISEEDYRKRLESVVYAFEGNPEDLWLELLRRRDIASGKLHFEKAALLNRTLESLERTSKVLEGIRNAKSGLNFILIEEFGCSAKLYLVAGGQLKSCFKLKDDVKSIARLKSKIARVYFAKETEPGDITAQQVENLSLLSSYFSKRQVKKVRIGVSAAETAESVLLSLGTMPLFPTSGIDACLDFQPRLQARPASHPRLSGKKRHS